MPHSLTKIWLHLVFSTKNRAHLIISKHEQEIYKYMKSILEKDDDCSVKIINGIDDHIHILYLQNPQITISETIKNLKGNSSHWINKQDFLLNKFSWQTGYGAFSVSESQVEKVYSYIANQKIHHKEMDFNDEYNLLIKKYRLI